MIYIRSVRRLMLVGLVLLYSGASQAVPVVDSPTGLAAPDTLIDFGSSLFPAGTVITNQFAGDGVIFGGSPLYFDCSFCNEPAIEDGHLFGSVSSGSPYSILFSDNVTDAVFSLRTNAGVSIFAAFLDGVLQASFGAATNGALSPGKFFGFSGLASAG